MLRFSHIFQLTGTKFKTHLFTSQPLPPPFIIILYFCNCQQTLWKDQNQHCVSPSLNTSRLDLLGVKMINYSVCVFKVMKEHVTRCNSVSHWLMSQPNPCFENLFINNLIWSTLCFPQNNILYLVKQNSCTWTRCVGDEVTRWHHSF